MGESAMEERLQDDPFLQLLTDALRAGPGSPEWHQAVARVKAGETGPDDEYALLVQARENLASGKSYREARAGAGFTRNVLASIERDAAAAAAGKSPISASLISYLGAGLMVGALGVIIFWVLSRNAPPESEDLSNLFFSRTVASVTFNAPLPPGWRLTGKVDLDPTKGLQPTMPGSSADFVGGAVISTVGMSPKEQFAVEAAFVFQQISPEVVPQLFVTDDPNLVSDKATSQRELVWMAQAGQPQIWTPDLQSTIVKTAISPGKTVSVRIVVGATNAVVMSDGAILWSGPNQLSADKPRYVGVRLLCRKTGKASVVTVKDLHEFAK